MSDWQGKRVLVIGAARQGLALARYLAGHGAAVILNDQRGHAEMEAAVRGMAGVAVEWVLGGHPLELLERVDLVCLSGGVPLNLPLVIEAQRRGLPLSNDSQIFMEAAPCPVVGITGSAGKTTTTTLVGRMAAAALKGSPRKSFVGGNIGTPLINQVDAMKPADLVVLELSSFQLEQMTLAPRVAALLNVTPNHLDRHGNMTAYTAAKARILDFQRPDDIAVLGREDSGAWALRERVKSRLVSFGLRPLEGDDWTGTFLQDERLYLHEGSRTVEIMPREVIMLRGEHNLVNVLGACAIAHAAGLPVSAMREGVEGFAGAPHRLEFIRELNGVKWYNDTIATAPERSMAGIHAFSEPLVLLAGGRDKKLPWGEFAALVHQRVDHLVVFGEASGIIMAAVGPQQPGKRPYSISLCRGLREAVHTAAGLAEAGDVVLLSPGGTSFDEFTDFEERGERFKQWVKELS